MESQVYSIWLPVDDVTNMEQKPIMNLVQTLSQRHATSSFIPHVTLMGGLQPVTLGQLITACKEASQSTSILDTNLCAVKKGFTYYKCVYGTFDLETSHAITALHRLLRERLSILSHVPSEMVDPTPLHEFEPHVSFIYGIEDETVKEDIRKHVETTLWENKSHRSDQHDRLQESRVIAGKFYTHFLYNKKINKKVLPTLTKLSSNPERVLLQIGVLYGKAVTKALLETYKSSALHFLLHSVAKKFNSRMGIDEARKILGLPYGPTTLKDIHHKFLRLYELNQPDGDFSGSPYLQKKIKIAETILKLNHHQN